jgi:hypothetical protein
MLCITPREKRFQLVNNHLQPGVFDFTEKRSSRGNAHDRTLFTASEAFAPNYGNIKVLGREQRFQFADQSQATAANAGTLASAETLVDTDDQSHRTGHACCIWHAR